jgi:hypothetical protein
MVVRPAGGDAEKKCEWVEWVGFAGEPAGREPIGRVTFTRPPATATDLATVVPPNLTLKAVDFPDLTDPTAADVGPTLLRDVAGPFEEDEDSL